MPFTRCLSLFLILFFSSLLFLRREDGKSGQDDDHEFGCLAHGASHEEAGDRPPHEVPGSQLTLTLYLPSSRLLCVCERHSHVHSLSCETHSLSHRVLCPSRDGDEGWLSRLSSLLLLHSSSNKERARRSKEEGNACLSGTPSSRASSLHPVLFSLFLFLIPFSAPLLFLHSRRKLHLVTKCAKPFCPRLTGRLEWSLVSVKRERNLFFPTLFSPHDQQSVPRFSSQMVRQRTGG